MLRIPMLTLVCLTACSFDSRVPLGRDGGMSVPDADPNAPDAGAPGEVERLRADPFGDGTPVAFVVDFANRVYLGPSKDGSRIFRMTYDGSATTSVSMRVHRGMGLTPFDGLGYNGCTDNVDCGPDGENRRGVFASALIGGTRWLIVGGAVAGGSIDHVYMSDDTSSDTIDLLFVDLAGLLGGSTRGLSSVHVAGAHTYLGFSDEGGNRPYLLDLAVTPSFPGFADVQEGSDAFNLEATDMPGVGDDPGPTNHAMIDSILTYRDRLVFGNDGGWMHSRNALNPPPYPGTNDYSTSTPENAEYANKTSVATTKVGDLLPADRAIPRMVEYQGLLYVARNTSDGPQLWRCDPMGSFCDPDNWILIAPNSTGDQALSQFNNGNNTAITLLESSGTHLFVGFDNASEGVTVYSTSNANPLALTDFYGAGGCVAGAGCPGIGGSGFGRDENTQFLDSETIDVGGGELRVYAVVGDTIAPLELYRFGIAR